MLVRFHGVRGSTPCHGDDIARYGGNTSCVSVDRRRRGPAAVRPRHRAALLRPRAAGQPFRGTCLVSHLHWDHVQGLPFFAPLLHADTELVVYAPVRARRPHGRRGAARRRSARRCSRSGSTGSPAASRSASRRRRFRIGGFEVESPSVPARRRRARLPRDPRRRERRLHQRPPAADVRRRASPTASLELCEGVDLLIHDAQYTPAEFARKSTGATARSSTRCGWPARSAPGAWRCTTTTRPTTTT